MRAGIVGFLIISLLIQLTFYVCDIIYLIANKSDINYQWRFNTGGEIFYTFWLFMGLTLMNKITNGVIIDNNYMMLVAKIFSIYGIIGMTTQIVLGFALNSELMTFLLIPIIALIYINIMFIVRYIC